MPSSRLYLRMAELSAFPLPQRGIDLIIQTVIFHRKIISVSGSAVKEGQLPRLLHQNGF